MAQETTTAQNEVQKKALEQAGVNPKPESSASQVAGRMMRELMDKKGAQAALEFAKGGKNGLNQRESDNLAARFTDPGESDKAAKRIDRANRFVDQGYDRLPEPEQEKHRDKVQEALTNSPLMGEFMRDLDPTKPEDVQAAEDMATGILKDKHYQAIVNERLQNISKREFTPKNKDIAARQARMQAAAAPGTTISDAQARADLEKEYNDTIQRDLKNVMGDSVHQLVRENLDTAEEMVITNGEAFDNELNKKIGEDITARLEQKWSKSKPDAYKKKGVIRQDWDKFEESGIDALLTADEKAHLALNPEMKKKMEAQIGQSLVLKRMRAGVLKKDDMVRLVDSKWLGDTQGDRIDNIRNIFEQHQGFKDLLADAQAQGFVDKDVWDKIKAAGPAAAAGGMIAVLIALMGLPGAAIGAAAAKVGIGGLGAAAAGGAAFGFNKFRSS